MHSSPLAQRPTTDLPAAVEPRPLVLVVDPDRSARSVLEVVLARDGFDVWSTDSASEALRLSRERRPDVVVLEAELGHDDGYMFCARLRGEAVTEKVPVVLLSKRCDEGTRALADVVGIDDVVEKPAFARDISALVRLELGRRGGTKLIEFNASQLAPAHLLRAMLSGPRSGRLLLADGNAVVAFRQGKVMEARFGKLSGIEALVRALMLTQGRWSLSLEPVNGAPELYCSLRELVHEVFPRLSKWSAVMARSVPLDARLQIDFARLAQALPSMPDEINHIVQLFDGFRTLQQVLLDSSYDETLTLEVASRLYLMGVVAPVAAGTEEPLMPRRAPRLFEPRPTEAEELMRDLFDGSAEIRADLTPAAALVGEDEDWFHPPKGSGLEMPMGDGGWLTAALSEAAERLKWPSSNPQRPVTEPVPPMAALPTAAEARPDVEGPLGKLSDLAPELAKQLDAFNIKTEIEPKQLTNAEKPVASFARGEDDEDSESLELVMRSATGDAPAQDEDEDDDAQSRIITPSLTPAVQIPELTGSLEPSTAFEPASAPAATAKLQSLPELSSGLDAPATVEAPAAASASVRLPPVSEAELEAAFFEPATPSLEEAEEAYGLGRKVLTYSALGVALLLAGVGIDYLIRGSTLLLAPEPETIRVLSDTPAPPVPAIALIEPVQAAEEELAPQPAAETVDVTEPLADARTQYESGQYKKAIATLEQVVSDAPTSVPAWLLLGLARYDANDNSGALTAVETVLGLDPKNARGYILQAAIRNDAGDKPGAKAALEKALDVDPKGAFADEAAELVRRWR